MSDAQRTVCNWPLVDLTVDNPSSIHFNLTGSHDRRINHLPELIDLTDDDSQHFTPNIPIIDLTGDNDQFLNYRIPIIDLTDDDHDISHQIQCIDLTCDEASSRKHAIRNYLRENDDKDTNHPEPIDLTNWEPQHFNPDTPVFDLTWDNDQFLGRRIQDIDMKDESQDIVSQLQDLDLTYSKLQKTGYDCVPATDHNHQIISNPDLTNNVRRPVNDLIRNDNDVIRKSVDDTEMNDLSCDHSPNSLQTSVKTNNNAIEKDFLRCNEFANMNIMHVDTFGNTQKFHRRKEIISANQLGSNFEGRKEATLTYHSRTNNFEKETILTNRPLRNNFEKETILTNRPLRHNFEEKYLTRRKSEKVSENNDLDLLKPAHRPIPLRHSFGRSTVNTSPNVPIECSEASKDQSPTLTVSSIMRRKKSTSSTDISKYNLRNSPELSTSREETSSFEALKGFVRKFWIFLLFTFLVLLVYIFGFKS